MDEIKSIKIKTFLCIFFMFVITVSFISVITFKFISILNDLYMELYKERMEQALFSYSVSAYPFNTTIYDIYRYFLLQNGTCLQETIQMAGIILSKFPNETVELVFGKVNSTTVNHVWLSTSEGEFDPACPICNKTEVYRIKCWYNGTVQCVR